MRQIKVHLQSIYEAFGESNLPAAGFHAFTGADQTGRFSGRSKTHCCDVFYVSNNFPVQPFISLGNAGNISDATKSGIEEYV